MFKKFFCFISLFLISICLIAENPVALDEIVVTATRIPVSKNSIGNSMDVIPAEVLQNYSGENIVDVLKKIKGVDIVQSGPTGSLSYIYTRGAEARHTLVLLNGIDISDPSNVIGYDLSDLTVDNIDRIEIVKGPQSVLYGSSAMGGVINIITKNYSETPITDIILKYGNYKVRCLNTEHKNSYKNLLYSIEGSYFSTDGFSAASSKYGNSEADASNNKNLNINLKYNLSNTDNLNLLLNTSKKKVDLDGYDYTFNRIIDDTNYYETTERLLFNIGYENVPIENIKIKTDYSQNWYKREGKNPDDLWTPKYNWEGKTNNFDIQIDYLKYKSNSISAGLTYKKENIKSEEGGYGWINGSEKDANTLSFFIQDIIKFKKLYFLLGLRNDKHNKFGNEPTFKTSINYNLIPNSLNLKSSYGKGFRAPSVYEIYAVDPYSATMAALDSLKPEISYNFDFGLEKTFRNSLINITYFYNKYDDLIHWHIINTGPTYINLDKVKTSGIEAELKFLCEKIYKNFDLYLTTEYTYLNTDADGKELALRSQNKSNISVEIKNNKLSICPSYNYIGSRFNEIQNIYKLSSYYLINCDITYIINKNLKFNLRVDNITNNDYEEVKDYGSKERAFLLSSIYEF